MQTVSAELQAAIEASERRPSSRVSVDWAGDGYGAAGTIDDLSAKVAAVQVDRDLQGTLPAEVEVVEGIAAATAKLNLVAGRKDDERVNTVRYWSRFNPASPMAAIVDRGDKETKIEIGFATSAGTQYVTRMTAARTRNLPVSVANRTASIDVVDARDYFRTEVELPAMVADAAQWLNAFPSKPGLEATWVASWLMWQAGYPLSPLPRPECRYWAPMHGSLQAFIAAPWEGAVTSMSYSQFGVESTYRPSEFVEGPFVLATEDTHSGVVETRNFWLIDSPAAGAPVWDSNGRATVRFEYWAKVGSGNWTSPVQIWINEDSGSLNAVSVFLNGLTGVMQVTVTNGAVTRNVFSAASTIDDTWRFYGVHVDDAAGRVAFRFGATTTVVTFTPTTANPGSAAAYAADDWSINIQAVSPAAEFMITTGIVEATTWQPLTHNSGAVVDRLAWKLDGIPLVTGEIWSLLGDLVSGSFGALYIDEQGRPNIASRGRFVDTNALVVQRTVTSRSSIIDIGYDDRLDQVRNVITAGYKGLTLERGKQVIVFDKSDSVGSGELKVWNLTLPNALGTSFLLIFGEVNTASDGSGTQAFFGTGITPNGFLSWSLERTSATTVRLTMHNTYPERLIFVTTGNEPGVAITGDPIVEANGTEVFRHEPSITKWGERPLTLADTIWRQRQGHAAGIAAQLAALLRDTQVILTDLVIPGDPRLQFFDRVRVQDTAGLMLDDDFTISGVHDAIDAAGKYDTRLVCRQARDQFLLGSSPLGDALIGV
jgi:hypothetical protein